MNENRCKGVQIIPENKIVLHYIVSLHFHVHNRTKGIMEYELSSVSSPVSLELPSMPVSYRLLINQECRLKDAFWNFQKEVRRQQCLGI